MQPLGPVMLDVAGLTLDDDDRRRLAHPGVGGVILFTRNYQSVPQLDALIAEIRAIRPDVLIAVDHEGGRVQRFREGFTRLPAMRRLGQLYAQDSSEGLESARAVGFVLAAELRAHGIDLSFAPVLDIDYGHSDVIGDRAFDRSPHIITALALALAEGMHIAGMGSCGKHFPGHGHVAADSHVAVPVDERPLSAIAAEDLYPFAALSRAGMTAVMPAHVIYPDVDTRPAGFSRIWLQDILRGELGFDGVIFSDDLAMAGAQGMGTPLARARAALDAGCDMVLLCNHRDQLDALLDGIDPVLPEASQHRLRLLRSPAPALSRTALTAFAPYQEALARVRALGGEENGPRPASDIVANL